jgi:uncharacterized protein (DUF952 family)
LGPRSWERGTIKIFWFFSSEKNILTFLDKDDFSMPDRIAYKIFSMAEFEAFRRDGVFVGSAADVADGFIHLSSATQVEGTLARHYGGRTDLILATVNLAALGDAVRWEESRGGVLFPHVYGVLPMAAVTGWGAVEQAARVAKST